MRDIAPREATTRWLEEGRTELEALRTILNDYDRIREAAEAAERECERLGRFIYENERLRSNLETTEQECERFGRRCVGFGLKLSTTTGSGRHPIALPVHERNRDAASPRAGLKA